VQTAGMRYGVPTGSNYGVADAVILAIRVSQILKTKRAFEMIGGGIS